MTTQERAVAPPVGRPGIRATQVRPASIERLRWMRAYDEATARRLRPGDADPITLARIGPTTVHHARDRDGSPGLVVRGPAHAIAARVEDLRTTSHLRHPGFRAATMRRYTAHELWLECPPTLAAPDHDAVARYVTGALTVAVAEGCIVGTGDTYARADGAVGTVDVVLARRLELDERRWLTSIWAGLVTLDAPLVADATSRMCSARPPALAAAARRAVLSLGADWSPVSVGLSLHHLAAAAAGAGPRSEPLVLLADELLHRLDLAYALRVPIPALSPTSALHLLNREAARS
jgi:hypothetical protein